MDFYFDPQPAVDTTTAELVKVDGLSGSVYASEADALAEAAPLTVTLAGGVSSSTITVSSLGHTVGFTVADHKTVWWRSGGGNIVRLVSFDGMQQVFDDGLARAEEIDASMVKSVNGELPDAEGNVVVAAGGGGDGTTTWQSLAGKPDTFPPSGHTHLRSEISNATELGRSTLGAATPQGFRSLIGAGTGNGTSDLVLGTSATAAAPGNHTHAQYVDAAAAATIADERIAANGGGSGSGSILVWRYSSGAYPTLPASKPAGVQLVHAMGPVAPSTVPSWIGNGPTQVPAEYVLNGGLT